MEGLAPGQRAFLQFAPPLAPSPAPGPDPQGAVETSLPCRLESAHGPLSTLSPQAELELGLRLRVRLGAQCFLVYEDAGGRVAVRGVALGAEDSELIEFIPVDGAAAADRRSIPRVPIITPVAMSRMPAEEHSRSVDTVTANLSAGGALLVRPSGLEPAPRWRIRLSLPDGAPAIVCEAALTRAMGGHLGVSFTTIAEADQVRIVRLLASRLRGGHGA